MNFTEFRLGIDDTDRRLDRIIRKFLLEIPLSQLYKDIRTGFIRINGQRVPQNYRTQTGDILWIADSLLKNQMNQVQQNIFDFSSEKQPIVLQNIFCNQHLRIINKGYGTDVQGSKINSLDRIVKREYLAENAAASLSFMPGPLHRLDKNTTGLLAFSQSLEGARWFSAGLADRYIDKDYLAVLSGSLVKQSLWEHYIDSTRPANVQSGKKRYGAAAFRTVQIFESPAQNAQYACSIAAPLAWGTFFSPQQGSKNAEIKHEFTLCLISIKTGRTHQIRAQSAFCGHPLLGDTAYGAQKLSFLNKTKTQNIQDFFLHAFRLNFPPCNPVGLPQTLTAPLPAFYANFLKNHLPHFDISPYIKSDETAT